MRKYSWHTESSPTYRGPYGTGYKPVVSDEFLDEWNPGEGCYNYELFEETFEGYGTFLIASPFYRPNLKGMSGRRKIVK